MAPVNTAAVKESWKVITIRIQLYPLFEHNVIYTTDYWQNINILSSSAN